MQDYSETDDTMHLKGDNVILIISERREMEDNVGGDPPIFSIEISTPRGQNVAP